MPSIILRDGLLLKMNLYGSMCSQPMATPHGWLTVQSISKRVRLRLVSVRMTVFTVLFQRVERKWFRAALYQSKLWTDDRGLRGSKEGAPGVRRGHSGPSWHIWLLQIITFGAIDL